MTVRAPVEEALAMCRMAWEEGTRVVAATAHLGEQWPKVTPERIRRATLELEAELTAAHIAFDVYPTAEVAVRPELDQLWQRGELLGVSGRNRYLLIEMPAGQLVDVRRLLCQLDALGSPRRFWPMPSVTRSCSTTAAPWKSWCGSVV